MAWQRTAVIMAGGAGERFWPVSTRERPKQFLHLTSPERSLLQEAVQRIAPLVGTANTYIVTGRHLAAASVAACPELPAENILAEPAKRNTTGALVWTAAVLIARYPSAWPSLSVAVLTADHRIAPDAAFLATVDRALALAESTGGLVTIGIRPTRPETGYGYVEVGEPVEGGAAVERFREKPDAETAREFVASGRFLWNSGMFFWTLTAFMAEMEAAQPETAAAVREMAGYLAAGDGAAATARFEALESVSIDYALMERARRVYVVPSDFEWDDLGAWDALSRSFPPDADGNVALGAYRAVESARNIVYSERDDVEVCLLGVDDLVVVITDGKILVCPRDRAQEVRRLAQSP